SITSWARASSVGGTSRPSALAVLRLMRNSNLVGPSTGRSEGLVPFNIRSTAAFRLVVIGRLAGFEDVERRRAPAPRSGDALDCRRKSGAEECGFAESDGALRDAMARGAQELRCSCRPVWPVDRPC